MLTHGTALYGTAQHNTVQHSTRIGVSLSPVSGNAYLLYEAKNFVPRDWTGVPVIPFARVLGKTRPGRCAKVGEGQVLWLSKLAEVGFSRASVGMEARLACVKVGYNLSIILEAGCR